MKVHRKKEDVVAIGIICKKIARKVARKFEKINIRLGCVAVTQG